MRGTTRLWTLSTAVGLTAAVTYSVLLPRLPQAAVGDVPPAALVLAFFAAHAWVVHLHFRREAHTVSLSEVPLTLGLLAAGPGTLLAALLVGSTAASVVVRRQPPAKAAFTAAQLALSATTALVVFRLLAPAGLGPPVWAAAIVAACVYTLVSVTLVSVGVKLSEGAAPAAEHLRVALLAVLVAAGTATLTVAGYRLVRADPFAAVLLVVPAGLWVAAVRGYTRTRSRHEHLEFLYESMREVQRADGFRGAAEQLLEQLARLLRADFVQLLFLGRGENGRVEVFTRRGAEVASDTRPAGSVEQLALIHAALSRRSVLLPRGRKPHPLDAYLDAQKLRDAMVVPLRGEERELGAIVVGNRPGDLATFAAEDARVFETFAAHAAVLLENDQLERSLEALTKLEAKLRHQAYHDSLTGLANRVAFLEATSEALAGGTTPPVVLFIDLDDFKTTNDSLGHAAGDALLRVAAQRVSACLRTDDVAARLGGDEFAILLRSTAMEQAEEIARRITARLEEPVQLDGHECSLRGSVGIAIADGRSTADTLLRDADLAMYAAKEARSGSHVLFRPEMERRVRARHSLASALSRSIERDELAVVYQPIVELEGGRVTGFEALVRWRRGDGGIILPDDFLEVAANTGVIASIGRFVLADACRRIAEWRRLDPALRVSVNLSAAELQDASLPHEIRTLLGAGGVDPAGLTIEITEASAMVEPEQTIRLLERLREIGVRIALDDFGTGYSSLSHLESMPLDGLKVPKELVDGLRGDRPRTVILGGIRALADSLGLGLVAEGVEDLEQLARLRELGYPEAQGFLIAGPLAPAEAGSMIGKRGLVRQARAA